MGEHNSVCSRRSPLHPCTPCAAGIKTGAWHAPQGSEAGNRDVQPQIKLQAIQQQGVLHVTLGDPVALRARPRCAHPSLPAEHKTQHHEGGERLDRRMGVELYVKDIQTPERRRRRATNHLGHLGGEKKRDGRDQRQAAAPLTNAAKKEPSFKLRL